MAFGSKIVRRLTQGLQQGGGHRATELGELDVAIYVLITAVALILTWRKQPEPTSGAGCNGRPHLNNPAVGAGSALGGDA